ncbi:MAG: NAD+ synthase [Candidatus Omnitrophota bacterium]
MNKIRIALAQINTTVGDMKGNTEKILSSISDAICSDADLVIFPELSITGYPPEDLLLKVHFVKDNIKYLNKITNKVKGITVVLGFVNREGASIYNSAAIVSDQRVIGIYNKIHLPNYGVFDERRYFTKGKSRKIIKIKGVSFAVSICEDIWAEETSKERDILSRTDFLVNLSASPYHMDKVKDRERVLTSKAKRCNVPILYCNLIGGQDELIFDGRSALFDKTGKKKIEADAFKEDLLLVDISMGAKKRKAKQQKALPVRKHRYLDETEEIFKALVLGVKDYARKNNFSKVALGLSGGIDSALVACIAKEALGNKNVLGLMMPSKYSSKGTQNDALRLAKTLGIDHEVIPINSIFSSYLKTLSKHFGHTEPSIAEENIQARIRGNILMAFSNKFGHLVLNTGNKSETSVGYCTLYGDMAGGFAVIKDVSKNLVYKLARYINKLEKMDIIPTSILDRPPSAELRHGQKDQDTLPPYDILDEIIELYIKENKDYKYIVRKIGKRKMIEKVLHMIDNFEYKRRQAPPGIKITSMAFGKDRRMPITNSYKEVEYGK